MTMVKVADLKNNLSRHLARVRRGGEIAVYDRDTPVARIVPFDSRATAGSGASDKTSARTAASRRVAELARQGIVSPGDPRAVADWLDDHRPLQRPAEAPSAVDLLLDMRRGSQR